MRLFPAALLVLTMALPAFAMDTVEGTIQGFNCVTRGICPAGSDDPLVTTEYAFVVVAPDGRFYFVPDVPQAVLAYRCTERVRVRGTLSSRYNKINARNVEIIKKGKWAEVWSKSAEFNPIPVL